MNYKGIEVTKEWFNQAIPEPTKEHQSIQLGCHAEEFAEMLTAVDLDEWAGDIDSLATDLKTGDDAVMNLEINRKELLDSLADQIVTAIGVAHMFGMDISGALEEVNRSNFSKFEDGKPVFNEHGKISKGKNYTPPDLSKFI